MSNKKGFTSEWRPISELRPVEINMSDFGYKKEYIEEIREIRRIGMRRIDCYG